MRLLAVEVHGVPKSLEIQHNARRQCLGDKLIVLVMSVRKQKDQAVINNLSLLLFGQYTILQNFFAKHEGHKIDKFLVHLIFTSFRQSLVPLMITAPVFVGFLVKVRHVAEAGARIEEIPIASFLKLHVALYYFSLFCGRFRLSLVNEA